MPRRQWSDLTPHTRAAVARETGDIIEAEDLAAGSVTDIATILTTARGQVFVKGVDTRTASPRAVRGHCREATLNAVLPAGRVPRLYWTIESDGWLLHGYERVPGRHADLSPGSPDITSVLVALDELTHALTPAPAEALAFSRRWADRIAPEAVAGDTLIHTDLTPRNLLVHHQHTWVVDWTEPCTGAAWIPYAFLTIRLIRAGHTPQAAEHAVNRAEAWQRASPAVLTLFAAAAADLWHGWHRTIGASHHLPLARAADSWSEYRTDSG